MKNETKFYRLSKFDIGNGLYTTCKNLQSFYENVKAGNDVDMESLDGIIEALTKLKEKAKLFDSWDKVKSTVYENNSTVKTFNSFLNEAKSLRTVNLEVLKKIIKTLKEHEVEEFRTQKDFHVFLEIHKFPELNNKKLNTGYKGPDKSYDVSMVYQNYTNIIEWLENKRIIYYEHNSKIKKVLIDRINLNKIDENNLDKNF